MKKKKVVAIIQARIGGSRLPGKVMMKLGDKPALLHIIERVRRAKLVDEIVVASPNTHEDKDTICSFVNELEIPTIKTFVGSNEDVLYRIFMAANSTDADIVVDITADCPLVDPAHIDMLVDAVANAGSFYASNCHPRSWPDGFDVQVYTFAALKKMNGSVLNMKHRCHVGWNMWNYRYECFKNELYNHLPAPPDYYYPEWGLTLDTHQDFILLGKIFKHFPDNAFTAEEAIDYIKENPELLQINNSVKRKTPGEG